MYSLRYPFKLPEGRSLLGEKFLATFGTLELTLEGRDIYYVLDIKGFEDSASAESYVPRVRTALAWLLIERGLACEAANELQPVQFSEDPKEAASRFRAGLGMEPKEGEELHAILDASRPAVLLSHGTYRTLTAHPVTILTSVKLEDAGKVLIEGVSFSEAGRTLDSSRLETALDLFRAHYSEATSRAKLLTLVMALETLVEPRERPASVVNLLKRFVDKVGKLEKSSRPGSPEAVAWESLKREFHIRGRDSIRSSIYQLVSNALNDQDPEYVQSTAKDARRIYDLRSKIVHGEQVNLAEINSALTDAVDIVKKVLRALFQAHVRGNA